VVPAHAIVPFVILVMSFFKQVQLFAVGHVFLQPFMILLLALRVLPGILCAIGFIVRYEPLFFIL